MTDLQTAPEFKTLVRNFMDEVLPGETMSLFVMGDSMLPTLREGDRVTVKRSTPGGLKLGDIVVFFKSSDPDLGTIIHRYIWQRQRGGQVRFYTKGDNRPNVEFFIMENFVGTVIEVERDKRAVNIGRSRWYYVLKGCVTHWVKRKILRT